MTEMEWLAATDPDQMLDYFQVWGEASDRKLQLFSVGCCRRLWKYLDEESGRPAVQVLEQIADGRVSSAENVSLGQKLASNEIDCRPIAAKNGCRVEVVSEAFKAVVRSGPPVDYPHAKGTASHAAVIVGGQAVGKRVDEWFLYYLHFRSVELKAKDRRAGEREMNAERIEQAKLVRDIFGNPFRSVAVETSWLTSDVLVLAEGIYQERAFDRMPSSLTRFRTPGATTRTS